MTPDSPATVALRPTCRARKDLVGHRVAVANQLRAHLRVFPGAVGLFTDLDSPISLRFLRRFDSQDRADWLTNGWPPGWPPRLQRPHRSRRLHARLTAAPRGTTGDRRRSGAHHPRAARHPGHPRRADQGPHRADHRAARRPRRRAHLHQPAPLRQRARRPAARRDRRLPRPLPHPRGAGLPAGAAPSTRQSGNSARSASAGPATNNSATPSATSPATPDTPTRGPPTSTTGPSPAATTTPTPSASSPAPGSTSSGTAGKTASPTTPPNTEPSRPFCKHINNPRRDTGLDTGGYSCAQIAQRQRGGQRGRGGLSALVLGRRRAARPGPAPAARCWW